MTASSPRGVPTPSRDDVVAVLDDPDALSLVYQPIADLARGVVVGFEALSRIRWHVPTGPDVWFAAAHRHGLAGELTAASMRRAFAARATMPADCFLTVNVEPHVLDAPAVTAAIAAAGDLRGIFFELTEHADVEDGRALAGVLAALRERGAMIAIDDAGSGYAGLRQILTIRPQLLKLDRGLVTGIPADEAKVALIEMLGELAGRLDAWLLAEGIEEAVELSTLRNLKVPLGQGYFLGRPAPLWSPLTAPAADALRTMTCDERQSHTAGPLIEPCATVTADAQAPAHGIAAGVDARGALRWLRFRLGANAVVRTRNELLVVTGDTPLEVVARRAATRPELYRQDVIGCCDDHGAFRGVIRIERLLSTLAALVPDALSVARPRRGLPRTRPPIGS